jgi:hypothetical protein
MLFLFPLMNLMVDAARVIELRLRMLAHGTSTPDEMFLMVTEKIEAMEQAKKIARRSSRLMLCVCHALKSAPIQFRPATDHMVKVGAGLSRQPVSLQGFYALVQPGLLHHC